MKEQLFLALVGELIDENPFACRALLQLVDIVFTNTVPTLAVSCGAEPRLLVNLAFVRAHCRTDEHVKAVICHEFLHVLLRHTERVQPLAIAEHLALDAVINAIIHRTLGEAYSSFMGRYYAGETGAYQLLRPWRRNEMPDREAHRCAFQKTWVALYDGTLVADDIRDIARDLLRPRRTQPPAAGWLGNHDHGPGEGPAAATAQDISPAVERALERALQSMNGSGIWRAPSGHGLAAHIYQNQVSAAEERIERWRREAWSVLRKHLLPDPRAPKTEDELAECRLPVLSPGDRRNFARALWSPLIPEAVWESRRRISGGSAQVYLDVSGSMNAEMPLIVALLGRLGAHIRRPFWAFSNVVAPAVIKGNRLYADTTGGTSMSCVLRHIALTRPRTAVIVTDGYIEALDPKLVQKAAGTRLHVLVTRDGSPAALQRARIPYTQLGRLPA